MPYTTFYRGFLRPYKASQGRQGLIRPLGNRRHLSRTSPKTTLMISMFPNAPPFPFGVHWGEVWDLTMNMIGSKDNPQLNAKGSETKNMLPWVISVFDEYADQFNALENEDLKLALNFAKEAATAASEFENILRSHDRHMSASDIQELLSKYYRFASLYERAGGNMVQKHHLMLHCIRDASFFGNPRYYTTYRSESFNGVLAKIARNCKEVTFYADMHIRAAAFNVRAISKHMA